MPKTMPGEVELNVPVLDHGTVLMKHVDFRMTVRQSRALRRLFDGLVAEGQTILLGGVTPEKIVAQYDALRWVLDKIADATEPQA